MGPRPARRVPRPARGHRRRRIRLSRAGLRFAADRENFLWRVTATAIIDHTTAEVVTALRAEGIRSVLLKGPVIARWLYDDPLERLYDDADLLVDPARLDDARALLLRMGFSGGAIEVSPHVPHAYGETWAREAIIEIHRTLSGIEASPEAAWAALAERTESAEVEGAKLEVLSDAGKLIVVTLHAAHHGIESKQPLWDLGRAVDRVPLSTWSEAADLARLLDASASFAAGLRLVERGPALLERIGLSSSRSLEAELRAASAPNMAVMLTWLRHGEAPVREKLVVVARKLVPPASWLEATSPLARRGRLGLAAAYLIRPIALAGRLPGAARALWRARRRS